MESNCIWKRARAHALDFFFDRLIDDSIKYFSDLMGCNETSWWFNVIETSSWWFSLLLWFLGSKTIERDVVMWWSNLLNLTIIWNHVKASRSLDKTRLAVCKCVVISTIMHAFLSNTEIFRWFISAIRCLVWELERSKGAHTCTPLLSSCTCLNYFNSESCVCFAIANFIFRYFERANETEKLITSQTFTQNSR